MANLAVKRARPWGSRLTSWTVRRGSWGSVRRRKAVDAQDGLEEQGEHQAGGLGAGGGQGLLRDAGQLDRLSHQQEGAAKLRGADKRGEGRGDASQERRQPSP